MRDAATRHDQITSDEMCGAVLEHAGHGQLGQVGREPRASQGRGLAVGGLLDELVQLGASVHCELVVRKLCKCFALFVHVGRVRRRGDRSHNHLHRAFDLIGKNNHAVHDLVFVGRRAERRADALQIANHLHSTGLASACESCRGQEVGGAFLVRLLGAASSADGKLQRDGRSIVVSANRLHTRAQGAGLHERGSRSERRQGCGERELLCSHERAQSRFAE
mmetsp:Transcript_2001/g.4140  ORF Transcript_2001/g.4140 Transcript_2001/m.4140 type:complete len:221 (-) Transcript_2001:172-834(-)